MKFTIGSDVELFAKKRGKFVSAIPLIGDMENGTKYNPIRCPGGNTIQRDNVAAEFATAVACGKEDFINKFRVAINDIMLAIPPGYSLHAISSVIFDQSQLNHPEALEFGCDPDFNAWCDGEVNQKPCATNGRLRSAGLHVHVGSPLLKSMKNKIRMIKMMDCYLSLPAVILDNSPESLRRKELYGKAGAFRPTSYGVEYRSLSNFWAKSPISIGVLYNFTELALATVLAKEDEKLINSLGGREEIVGVINSGNVKLAEKMVKVQENGVFSNFKSLESEWSCHEK